ncbi:MAG TPA: hypothetical protein VJM34_19065 [Novosphingobium sp.]|nr:hypothetical protein [Novosphingobium sp.]
MSFAAALLTPLALLLPSEGAGEAGADFDFPSVAAEAEPPVVYQVRIEQRMTIRISPRPSTIMPNVLMSLPSNEVGPQFEERKIGSCVDISRISGVQTNGNRSLILFMRDRRMVSAQLEKTCRARDFYSGFYLAPSQDGKLCIDRDTLQSRSGANCRLTRIRRLVEIDE